jgi:hypothetical protein
MILFASTYSKQELRNEFVEKTKGMNKEQREQIYQEYTK